MRTLRRTPTFEWTTNFRLLGREAWEANRPDADALARLLGAQYLVGAAVLFAGLALPTADASDRPQLCVVGGVALAVGLLLRFGPRPGQVFVDCSISLAVFFVTACVMISRPMGLVPLFYFWPLMLTVYYATPAQMLVNVTLTIAGFGFALATTAETGDRLLAFVELTAVVVVVAAAVARLRMKAAELFAQLQRTAALDPLTSTLNRRGFEERLHGLVAASQGSFAGSSFIAVDVDHFKRINDTRGHAFGDQVLRELVRTIQGAIRSSDILGRVGGEEFALVLPATVPEEAHRCAEDLRRTVSDRSRQRGMPVTVSIGVATGPTVQIAWEQADRAMYRAKEAGRDQTVLVSSGEVLVAVGDAKPTDGPGLADGPAWS